MLRFHGHRRTVTRLLPAVVLVFLASPALCRAEARFEDRGGVLYVTDGDRPTPQKLAATARSARATTTPRNADAFRHLIREAADRYAVASDLIESVIRVESNFEPRAVSSKGARGLMQLMPGTAKILGVQDSFDVGQNIDAGVRHLRNLLELYKGSLPLALAAYNAGAEAVARYGGVPPFSETQAYVTRILYLIGRTDLAVVGARIDTNANADAALYRYQAADGALVYSNVPASRLSGVERAVIERRP